MILLLFTLIMSVDLNSFCPPLFFHNNDLHFFTAQNYKTENIEGDSCVRLALTSGFCLLPASVEVKEAEPSPLERASLALSILVGLLNTSS